MRVTLPRLVLGAMGAAGIWAARRVAFAPPDPRVAARAYTTAHAGPWTHGYRTVNGVRLHYAELGSGPLLLLLHGYPQNWYMWHAVMQNLGTRFHVVAPDMRGYNESDKPAGIRAYGAKHVAQDIVALIESFGQERAHVVGHDWGGLVAWRMGMFHPGRLDKLVVINAPHPVTLEREYRRLDQLFKSAYVLFFQLPLLSEAAMRLSLRSGLRSSAAVPGAFSDDDLDMYEAGMAQPGAATAMLNYYRAAFWAGPRWFADHKRVVRVPTLVIWGMKDFALSSRLVEGLEEWVPDLRVERIEESGHWVPEEKPRLVSEFISGFLG